MLARGNSEATLELHWAGGFEISRPQRVEHGTVDMLDHYEPCHGFEHGDFYLPTFRRFRLTE